MSLNVPRFFVSLILVFCVCAPSQYCVGIEYDGNMPDVAPNYPGLGWTDPYEKTILEVGSRQQGVLYKSVYATYGPTTAGAESSGTCDGTTISSSLVKRYELACTALYSLFSIGADWNSTSVTLQEQRFETCCEEAGCTVPKKYIHATWAYVQLGNVTRARVKVNALGQLDRSGTWCDWKVCSPCDAKYCTLYTRAAYSSSSSNLAGTHDAPLRTGVPDGAPCSP